MDAPRDTVPIEALINDGKHKTPGAHEMFKFMDLTVLTLEVTTLQVLAAYFKGNGLVSFLTSDDLITVLYTHIYRARVMQVSA